MAARKRVVSEMHIKSWVEADAALKQIAELGNLLAEQEIELNRQVADLKTQSEQMTKPMQDKIKVLEQQIKEFADSNRTDLEGKTKALTFGKIGYRLSSSLTIPKNKEADIIQLLRKQNMLDCINTKESVNKENLKRRPLADILGLGLFVKQKDEFWYEVERTPLAPADK